MFAFFAWNFELRGIRILLFQHRAESFNEVKGKIVSGEVTTTRGSRSSTYYHPSFLYEYQVDGTRYTARRYRYDGRPRFLDAAAAQRIVEAHPIGSEIEVYYNPVDPRDAVLSKEVQGFDVGFLLIGAPFCLLMLSGMIQPGVEFFLRSKPIPVAGGVKIISDRMTTRVRLPQTQPAAASLFTMAGLSLIGGIATIVPDNLGLKTAEMIVLLIILAGIGVYWWLRRKVSSGDQDLIIDEAARTLQLPLTFKRRNRVQFSYSEVSDVFVDKVAIRRKNRASYKYVPTLRLRDDSFQQLVVLREDRAEPFAVWLREKLGLAAKVEPQLSDKGVYD